MPRKRKLWSHTEGERPNTVTVFERHDQPDGPFYVRVWDPRAERWVKRSLGHRDKERAKIYAKKQALALAEGMDDVRAGRVTLGQLFDLYKAHRTPRKSEREQKADARRMELWKRVLGTDKDPHRITLGEWEAFTDARAAGAIDARGHTVPEKDRKPVRAGTLAGDLRWMRYVLGWGTKWQDRRGRYLLRENCVRGYEIPDEKNPRRPVATQDRYEATLAVADQVTMEARWAGARERVRSHLREMLVLANGTGRRISSIRQLRYSDILTDRGPHGAVRWRADTDKTGRETLVPINPAVRAALDGVLRERPGIGDAYLFPSPADPGEPVSRHLADKWLRVAEAKAGLEPLKGSLWHAYRRKWATERKHLPDPDVAKAGGWAGPETLRHVYQQADEETMLEVVLGGGELRERKA